MENKKVRYCEDCGKSEEEARKENKCKDEDLEIWSVILRNWDWYCNEDCYKNSH